MKEEKGKGREGKERERKGKGRGRREREMEGPDQVSREIDDADGAYRQHHKLSAIYLSTIVYSQQQ